MKHKGFTIVELVVVIAVIGILAAITVVGYGAWRDRAAKTEVMSDLRNASLAMKNYLNFNNELPPNLAATGFKESPNVLVVRSSDSNTLKYCLQGSSRVKPSIVYYVNSVSAKDPVAGTCPSLPADPTPDPNPTPVILTGYSTIKSSGSNTCAIAINNKAYCWGGNYYGSLGNGTYTNSLTPVAVSQGAMPAGATIKQLAVGGSTTCAIASDDKAYCWGYGEYGQLGNGTNTERQNIPVAVSQGAMPAGSTVKQIYSGNSNFCVIASNDKAYCWGSNGSPGVSFGIAFNGDTNTPVAAVSQGAMPAGATIKQMALGSSPHGCAIASDNKMYCWGRNEYGQLGNGTTTNSQTPVAVSQGAMPAGSTIKQITTSSTSTCAIASNDKAYCWGYNADGQAGNGTITPVSTGVLTPVAVSQGAMPAGATIKQIDGLGSGFTFCALASDNKAYCWGRGGNGELGNGNTADSSTPVDISQFTMPSGLSVSKVTAKCVVMSNSMGYCWGINSAGQLGNGSTASSTSPLKVNDPYSGL